MEKDQLVEVFGLMKGQSDASSGSGYLIGPRLVLTSAHVLLQGDKLVDEIELRVLGHTLTESPLRCVGGTVAWRRYDNDGKVDAALVEIVAENWVPPETFRPVVWGVIENNTAPRTPVQLGGFPKSVETDRGRRDPILPRAEVEPGGYVGGRTWFSHLTSPRSIGDNKSLWEGFSGGPVFGYGPGEDLLLGVIARDLLQYGSQVLDGTLIEHILDDPEVEDVLDRHGMSVHVRRPWSLERFEQPNRDVDLAASLFDAELIPPGWQPGLEPLVLECAQRYRLDSLAGATVGAFTLVVGTDQVTASLASALEAVRFDLPHAAEMAGRAWVELRDLDPGDLADVRSVRASLSSRGGWDVALKSADGARIGIVIPVQVGTGGLDAARLGTLRRTIDRLRTLLPAAGLIVQVGSGEYLDVARTVQVISGALEQRAFRPAALLLPCRPPLVRPDGNSGDALATLTAELQHQLQLRELHWAVPVVQGQAGRGMSSAGDIVAELNMGSLDLDEERSLLRLVRCLLPSLYPGILQAHAASRIGASRYISLAVAAESADDVGIWLGATGGGLEWPDPEEIPRSLRNHNLTEAVLLEMLGRFGSAADVQRWVEHGVGLPSRVVQALAVREPGAWSLNLTSIGKVDQKSAGLVAQCAVRCGQSVADLPPGSAPYPLFWAMLFRDRLTAEVMGRLRRLPPHLQAVVGRPYGATDIEIADLTCTLRQQIPHLTTRSL